MIHWRSMIESICNVGSGFIISLIVWEFIIKSLFNIEKDFTDGLQVTMIFTVISVVRGYVWRRIFDRRVK